MRKVLRQCLERFFLICRFDRHNNLTFRNSKLTSAWFCQELYREQKQRPLDDWFHHDLEIHDNGTPLPAREAGGTGREQVVEGREWGLGAGGGGGERGLGVGGGVWKVGVGSRA